jgi:hypothetical protein
MPIACFCLSAHARASGHERNVLGRSCTISLIHFSNSSARRLAGSRKRRAKSPAFFVEAPGRPVSRLVFSPLGKARGMARQVTQPFVLCRPVFPLENTGGASWRATRTSSCRPGLFAGVLLTAPGRAFRWPFQLETDHPSAKLLAGGSYWPPDGAPVPPGCVLAKHARGRRIPAPPSDASR